MAEMIIPHRELLDEIALTLIPITLQLPHVSALLKWLTAIQTAGDVNVTHPTHWIAALNPHWTFLFEEKLQGLLFLQHFINDMESPLIKLMESLADFAPFKELQPAIYNLQQAYSDIPYIETEVAMLSSGCNILEQKDLLPTLLYYLDKVTTFVIKVEHLKETLLHTLIHNASHSFFPQDTTFCFPDLLLE